MSDRISSLTVTLEANIRDDDAEPIIAAIRQLRGVLAVDSNVADLAHHVARQQARAELERPPVGLAEGVNMHHAGSAVDPWD